MATSLEQLSLFAGDHIPGVRFRVALADLDLATAVRFAPDGSQADVERLEAASRAGVARSCRIDGSAAEVRRAWVRLVARELEAMDPPGAHDGALAADWFARGGEPERARASAIRSTTAAPADPAGWAALGRLGDVPAMLRCAFHGGPVADHPAILDLAALIEEDGAEEVGPWLLPYAVMARRVGVDLLREVLAAAGLEGQRPLPLPGDPMAFACWMRVAEDARRTGHADLDARRRLRAVSPAAFARYLGSVG